MNISTSNLLGTETATEERTDITAGIEIVTKVAIVNSVVAETEMADETDLVEQIVGVIRIGTEIEETIGIQIRTNVTERRT